MRALDTEVVEERVEVVDRRRGPGRTGVVGRHPEAALIPRDDAVLLGEHRHLLEPHRVVAAETMAEDDDLVAVAGDLVVDLLAGRRDASTGEADHALGHPRTSAARCADIWTLSANASTLIPDVSSAPCLYRAYTPSTMHALFQCENAM